METQRAGQQVDRESGTAKWESSRMTAGIRQKAQKNRRRRKNPEKCNLHWISTYIITVKKHQIVQLYS